MRDHTKLGAFELADELAVLIYQATILGCRWIDCRWEEDCHFRSKVSTFAGLKSSS
jgi:hypothetical protein